MVMKEIPREESAEEKPLLTMKSQVGRMVGIQRRKLTYVDCHGDHNPPRTITGH